MERLWFDWDGVDENGLLDAQFYDCKLKVQIGRFPAGTKIDVIQMDYDTGHMTFYEDEFKVLAKFKIGLLLGEEVKNLENSDEI